MNWWLRVLLIFRLVDVDVFENGYVPVFEPTWASSVSAQLIVCLKFCNKWTVTFPNWICTCNQSVSYESRNNISIRIFVVFLTILGPRYCLVMIRFSRATLIRDGDSANVNDSSEVTPQIEDKFNWGPFKNSCVHPGEIWAKNYPII